MSIHLGFPTTDASTVSPALAARGISLLRAPAGRVLLVGTVKKVQLGYRFYKTMLPAYMRAWVTRAEIPLAGNPFHPISFPVSDMIPIRLPPLSLSFPKAPTSQALEVLATIGYEKVKVRGADIYYLNEYTLDQARTLRTIGAAGNSFTPKGRVNLDVIGPFVAVCRIFSNFLKAHSYAAFQIEKPEIAQDVDDVAPPQGQKRKLAAAAGSRHDDASMETEDGQIDTIKFRVAKPPRNDYIGWGPASDMPNTSGIYLPYIPDLAAHDPDIIPSVINEFFMECLGSSDREVIDTHRSIIRAWGQLHLSETGNILSHIAVGIRLAIQTQSFCYVILERGVFEGIVVCGAQFTVGTRNGLVSPVNHANLQTEVNKAGSHSASLDAIAKRCGDKGHMVLAAASMRQLAQVLAECQLSEADRDHIKRDARRLNFPHKFWAVNATTIIKALDLIRDRSLDIDDVVPLHPSMIFTTDRIELVLSAFGFQAPSFNIPSTPEIKLQKGQPAPTTFAVRIVDLSIAISDMKKVIDTKTIHNNPKALSSRYQDRSLGGVEKEMVYGALLHTVGATDVVEAATGGDEGIGSATAVLDW